MAGAPVLLHAHIYKQRGSHQSGPTQLFFFVFHFPLAFLRWSPLCCAGSSLMGGSSRLATQGIILSLCVCVFLIYGGLSSVLRDSSSATICASCFAHTGCVTVCCCLVLCGCVCIFGCRARQKQVRSRGARARSRGVWRRPSPPPLPSQPPGRASQPPATRCIKVEFHLSYRPEVSACLERGLALTEQGPLSRVITARC